MSIRDFQIISKLGEGAYSSVYKVKRLSDSQEYALKKVKLLNLSEKEKQNALNEVRILASIRHTNMCGYKEAFLEESSNSLCIVMEYANNGDLFQKIVDHQKKGSLFSEPEIWSIFIQMVKGLKALHDLKILHRDLKSANIFLNKDGTVKLGDLNVSKVAKKGLLYTQTGTPYYASPEVWRDMPYDHKSDVWSLGCVLYEMTTLKPPFRAEDMEGLYKKVLRGYYPRIPTHFSQDLNNIIRALLQVSPHLRPSCDKMLQLPAVLKRMDDKHLTEIDETFQANLLTTIRIPKNLHFLTERLPKANYSPIKTRKVEKQKFLQTLAGYKDTSQNTSGIEEAVRGSESVEPYQKKGSYLPPLGKDAQAGNEIIKIYGKEKKYKNPLLEGEPKMIAPLEMDIPPMKKNNENRKYRVKERTLEKDKEKERDRSIEREPEIERIEKESTHKYQSSIPVQHKEIREIPAYKIHDLNKDVDKHLSNIKHIYGGKSNGKIPSDISPIKDPLQAIIKKNKYPIESDPHDDEYLPVKKHALPPIGVIGGDKYSKLPPLKGPDHSPHVGKSKLKELSRVYKVNIGNLDELGDKYNVAPKPLHKREKYKPDYAQKHPGQGSSNHYLDSALNNLK
jgi:serine/threonine protein kinase